MADEATGKEPRPGDEPEAGPEGAAAEPKNPNLKWYVVHTYAG